MSEQSLGALSQTDPPHNKSHLPHVQRPLHTACECIFDSCHCHRGNSCLMRWSLLGYKEPGKKLWAYSYDCRAGEATLNAAPPVEGGVALSITHGEAPEYSRDYKRARQIQQEQASGKVRDQTL